jgi:hypothetical protein
MVDLSKIALAKQMLDSAEKSVQSARQLLLEVTGVQGKSLNTIRDKAAGLTSTETGEGRIVEGVFDGMNMVGPDGKQYPVPANYASKSKLIEGDTLKLTILEDGSFVYKQIGPVERDKALGTLTQGDNGDWHVLANGRSYRVLLASVTYFKGEVGDEATIVVPKGGDSEWGAVENIIKKGANAAPETAEDPTADDLPEEEPAHQILKLDDVKD